MENTIFGIAVNAPAHNTAEDLKRYLQLQAETQLFLSARPELRKLLTCLQDSDFVGAAETLEVEVLAEDHPDRLFSDFEHRLLSHLDDLAYVERLGEQATTSGPNAKENYEADDELGAVLRALHTKENVREAMEKLITSRKPAPLST